MFSPRMKTLLYCCKCIHFTRSKICYAFKWPCGLTVKALAKGLRACCQRWEVRIPPRLVLLRLLYFAADFFLPFWFQAAPMAQATEAPMLRRMSKPCTTLGSEYALFTKR